MILKTVKRLCLHPLITMSHRVLIILSALVLTFMAFLTGPGCANMIPPAGGPKDSLAPMLVKADPRDSTLNFSGSRLVFTFDEYVEVQNVQQELLVSPVPRVTPSVDYRLNTVTVRLKDSLEANTTYSFNFGNSIKDINEGNVMKNFTYSFSTGSYMDSLEFVGNVLLAETGQVDTTLIVMLHSSADDSAVVNEKPRYVTKLDNRGRFRFRNLPPRTYYVYALKDETNTRRYFDDKQLFAFANTPVTISDSTAPITLYAFANKPLTIAPPVTPPAGTGSRNRNAQQNTDRRLKFNTNLLGGQQDLLSTLQIDFEQPLRSFDSSKLSLWTDSNYTAASFRVIKDSNNRKIIISSAWKEAVNYHLIMDKEFAEDSLGRKLLKTDTLHFTTKKLSDYGRLKMRLRNLDLTKNPVLQFVQNGNVIRSASLTSSDYQESLFLPGEYELRIVSDRNKNGEWDTGQFFGEHRQPERVRRIARKINVKANWDNEIDIQL